MAMLTTEDQRDLLESLGMCHNLISWLQTMLDTLENRTDIMDAPDFKRLLVTCSMYLSQHEDEDIPAAKFPPGAKFPLGQLRQSVGVAARVESDAAFPDFVGACLRRHIRGDWGEVSEQDRKDNDEGLKNGDRLLSLYIHEDKTKIRIITEWDRSVTTILFPDEY
jgi:hypothetical protein